MKNAAQLMETTQPFEMKMISTQINDWRAITDTDGDGESS